MANEGLFCSNIKYKYYFKNLGFDGGYEPKLLKLVNNKPNHFKFANNASHNSFKIAEDNSLLLLNETGEIIAIYKSQKK